ncbi:NADP-dependent oxidoreductase [Mesorhizobium sp. M6A.T.Ce.TU.016.01.1.1]|uniref:NADP-dependent oxidoreductase n=1 Tax=Mesorhizobium sp. M6A.T.Ce.TU.016.01.1.1 TaxID=2496783 RepID=UPI000FCBA399|nr:NADP-dependent oxidoreductase [Mesorhizobium sp. M6A.T.Ce.TU.016.01.1.1]RUU25181.1 NADP-dependent oxidoreductase [Mesorhizobium sp. M6A.T.Ce.TU.016.01.1.1]
MAKNPSWVLRSYPSGMPTVGNWMLEDRPIPGPAEGELLLKTLWLSVDPYMRGRISPAKNYAAGFGLGDLMSGGGIGEVISSESLDFKPGDIVMSDYFGWQPFTTIPASSAKIVTATDAPVQASLSYLGMPGLTAYFSLLKTGNPKEGETVLISAASGGVGQIAGQIARIKGLDPVAVVGTDAKLEWCKKLGYREGINHRTSTDLVADVAAACPNGVDVFIDNTAGPIHDAAMLNLNTFGRVVIVGTIALADRFDQPDIGLRHLRKTLITRARIEGFLLDDHEHEFETAKADLLSWYKQGLLETKEDVAEGIEAVPYAFVRMLNGENFGKQLIKL